MEQLRELDEGNNLLDAVIRTESLEEDLIRVLAMAGHDLTDAQKQEIRSAGRTNTSTHWGAEFYYDGETIEYVARGERFLIEKYGYTPPAPRAP